MAIAQMEEIVTTVKAILKTLECPICLDLLKTPVSAGCGHFFCRDCVSGILQSTYRAPCPLCKRSFTRRSIQEAAQRQNVISAARVLANTCTNLTEIQFFPNDPSFKELPQIGENLTAPQKKLKISKPENQETSSRKRKSFEIEGNNKTPDPQKISENEMNKCNKINDNLADDNYLSPNKRVCQDSDNDDDSEDLPKLEDVFQQIAESQKNSRTSMNSEKVIEKPLTIFPTDKVFAAKTYSSFHKKAHKSNLSRMSSDDASKCKIASLPDKNKDTPMEKSEKIEAKSNSPVKNNSRSVQAKNKLNALKNKTNEVQSDPSIIQNNSGVKAKNANKVTKSDVGNKAKENALCLSPKASKIGKLRRKSQTKNQNLDTNLSSKCSSEEIVSRGNVTSNEENTNEKYSSSPVKNSNAKDCYTLNQVTLLNSETVKEKGECLEKQTDDPFTVIGLTDTVISVDSVTSPLATKNLSLDKSPGWSRVRKGKKDFKLKKFTSLHVEKNSPNVSNKNSSASDQESVSVASKSDNSVNATTVQNINEEKSLDSADKDAMDIAAKDSFLAPKKGNGDGNLLVNKEMDDNMKCDMNNTEESNVVFEKMDCSGSGVANSEYHAEDNLNLNNPPEAPPVSVTSNLFICTEFADDNDKISSHNVLISQKNACELNQTPLRNDLVSQSGNLVSKYICDNNFNQMENKKFLSSNPSDLKEAPVSLPMPFTSYQSFDSTSMESSHNLQYIEQSQQTSQILNLDFHNRFCNNIKAVVPHQPPLLVCPISEKTKVVKRTCLTLEEIQDCFLKSSQSGLSETLCSVPFFSGLFKLHIGVADETLNVSVLKVIDPAIETNNPPCAASVLSDKNVQVPSCLFPSTEVVPSSNAESESSQPDSSIDPFPYLSKESAPNLIEKPVQVAPEIPGEPLIKPNLNKETVAMHDEPALQIVDTSVKNKDDIDDNCMDENGLNMSEIIHFPSNPADGDNAGQAISNSSKSAPHIKNCEKPRLETNMALNECSALLKKNNSEGDAESLLESVKNNQFSSDKDDAVLGEEFEKCKKSSDTSLFNKTKSSSSKSEQMCFDELSSSDEDESLKKLQQCLKKERAPASKNKSRLSLKKKSSFKRIQMQESSDESDSEISLPLKDSSKKFEEDVFTKPKNPPKLASVDESLSPLRESSIEDDSNKNVLSPAPAEMPSTLNSILSDDASEANATEMISEIEDLSDRIKFLEEKLKKCGHDEGKHNKGDSDSEDSVDLFPQSVPPTPPNKI